MTMTQVRVKGMTPAQTANVDAVKEHAQRNYEEGGWDFVVETMTEMDILEVVRFCNSGENAIRAMAKHVALLDDHRSDIMGTAF
jgi:hypothetical protein